MLAHQARHDRSDIVRVLSRRRPARRFARLRPGSHSGVSLTPHVIIESAMVSCGMCAICAPVMLAASVAAPSALSE
eukprot:1930660-Prymnesium_polylepis.1